MQHRVDAGPGRAFSSNPSVQAAEVCKRVKEVLEALEGPVSMSREEVFKKPTLWSLEIRSTCGQAIEYYESIRKLLDHGLRGPAAALSRSIHEASFRLEYLMLHDAKLADWMDWQFQSDYFFHDDCLKHDLSLSEATKQWHEKKRQEAHDLLGGRPIKRPKGSWTAAGDIREGITANMPERYGRMLNRLLYRYPSRFVHIRLGDPPLRSISLTDHEPTSCL